LEKLHVSDIIKLSVFISPEDKEPNWQVGWWTPHQQ